MYDALIIGSGIGSLTTAGLLAQTAGLRVLVLEKHSTPGGLTHSFRAMGASWDVGLHYVGDMEPGSRPRQLLDYLTGQALSWTRMPTGYDRFYLPGHGLDVTIPSSLQEYRCLLTSLFPREKRAIRRYCADVQRAYSWMSLGYVREMVHPRAAPAVRLTQRALAGCALELTEHYMERRFRDPALRALLTTHWGDYGVEPARSAFVAHAMIVCHYMNGAWFPSGGSGQIARMIEEGIVGAGGQIRLAQEVEEILVEDGTAVGVRVTDRSSPAPVSYEERAPIIISGIGARETYTRLLPATGPTAALTARVRERIARLGHGASAVTLYLALDRYPDGVDGANVWINTATGRADPARMSADLLGGHPHSAFISFPGIKSGDTHATAEIVSFAQPEAFQRWAGTRTGLRGEDYEALTSAMSQGLIDLADTAVPGLKDAVRYAEVGTPLTIEHFTSHSLGCFYGLPLTPREIQGRPGHPLDPHHRTLPHRAGCGNARNCRGCSGGHVRCLQGPRALGVSAHQPGAASGGYQANQPQTLSGIRGSAQRRSEALSSNSAARQLDHPNYPRHHTPAPTGWNLGCGSVRAHAGRPFRVATLFDRLCTRESRAPACGRAHPGAWRGVGTPRTKRRRGGS